MTFSWTRLAGLGAAVAVALSLIAGAPAAAAPAEPAARPAPISANPVAPAERPDLPAAPRTKPGDTIVETFTHRNADNSIQNQCWLLYKNPWHSRGRVYSEMTIDCISPVYRMEAYLALMVTTGQEPEISWAQESWGFDNTRRIAGLRVSDTCWPFQVWHRTSAAMRIFWTHDWSVDHGVYGEYLSFNC